MGDPTSRLPPGVPRDKLATYGNPDCSRLKGLPKHMLQKGPGTLGVTFANFNKASRGGGGGERGTGASGAGAWRACPSAGVAPCAADQLRAKGQLLPAYAWRPAAETPPASLCPLRGRSSGPPAPADPAHRGVVVAAAVPRGPGGHFRRLCARVHRQGLPLRQPRGGRKVLALAAGPAASARQLGRPGAARQSCPPGRGALLAGSPSFPASPPACASLLQCLSLVTEVSHCLVDCINPSKHMNDKGRRGSKHSPTAKQGRQSALLLSVRLHGGVWHCCSGAPLEEGRGQSHGTQPTGCFHCLRHRTCVPPYRPDPLVVRMPCRHDQITCRSIRR